MLEVRFELDLASGPMKLCAHLPNRPVSLCDLAELARSVCDQIVQTTRRHRDHQMRGQAVPCRRGCSVCCHFLVPLSVPEALDLDNRLADLPPHRRRKVEQSLDTAARRVLGAWGEADTGKMTVESLSQWYSGLQLPCPFLTKQSCSIYPHRPLACREHLAIGEKVPQGHAATCPGRSLVAPPTSVLDVLATLTAELEGKPLESVVLPLAPYWAEANRSRGLRTYPARKVLERFVDILRHRTHARVDASAA